MENVSLMHVVTTPVSLGVFLRGQPRHLAASGFDVQAVASPGKLLDRFGLDEQIDTHTAPLTRKISPLTDLRALVRLTRLFRRERPTIVHTHTPKAGLVGMIAAWLARTPVRLYTVHGLPLETATGLRRRLLWLSERVACRLASRVICVSDSVRQELIESDLCQPEKAAVLGHGSANGVDAASRFNPKLQSPETRQRVRTEVGAAGDSIVVGFVGRLTSEKGVEELLTAWRTLRRADRRLRLLVLGGFEERDPVSGSSRARLAADPTITHVTHSDDMPRFYAAMDLLVLPTYREGLPTVLLEAAAMGLPAVATRVTGCVDAVVEGETGKLVPARDADALAATIRQYTEDPDLRAKHGEAARQRALRHFQPQGVWQAVDAEYRRLLDASGQVQPEVLQQQEAA
ncbi:MAG: glycosyltransferase family 4 protein [Planctomycetota bacterium]